MHVERINPEASRRNAHYKLLLLHRYCRQNAMTILVSWVRKTNVDSSRSRMTGTLSYGFEAERQG